MGLMVTTTRRVSWSLAMMLLHEVVGYLSVMLLLLPLLRTLS